MIVFGQKKIMIVVNRYMSCIRDVCLSAMHIASFLAMKIEWEDEITAD